VVAHWAETDYGLSAGQHAFLPEGKDKGKGTLAWNWDSFPENFPGISPLV